MDDCRRCGNMLRIATEMPYDFKDIRVLVEKFPKDEIPKKYYLVCDNCFLGSWVDSREVD